MSTEILKTEANFPNSFVHCKDITVTYCERMIENWIIIMRLRLSNKKAKKKKLLLRSSLIITHHLWILLLLVVAVSLLGNINNK